MQEGFESVEGEGEGLEFEAGVGFLSSVVFIQDGDGVEWVERIQFPLNVKGREPWKGLSWMSASRWSMDSSALLASGFDADANALDVNRTSYFTPP